MNHICTKCKSVRDCRCGDCGEKKEEICTKCNNLEVIPKAQELGIPLSELSQDPLGGYHFKEGQL